MPRQIIIPKAITSIVEISLACSPRRLYVVLFGEGLLEVDFAREEEALLAAGFLLVEVVVALRAKFSSCYLLFKTYYLIL
jgi:hypothetical protein